MNIVFAINKLYINQLCTCIVSLLENNRKSNFKVWILHNDLTDLEKGQINKIKIKYKNFDISFIKVDKENYNKLNITIDYIPRETYFRYEIANLINVEKCLYLDADLIINGNIKELYDTDIENFYCAGCRDLYIETIKHKSTINLENNLYINAGVILFNLKKIREDNISKKFFENTTKLQDISKFQDQDIINITCKDYIKEINSKYNYASENMCAEKEKRQKAIIFHYTGPKKPWDKESKTSNKNIWEKYNKIYEILKNKKIKVGLIIDEFFGGAGTAYGGYGFLARKYICKYIPNDDIQIDVLLGKSQKNKYLAEKFHEDGTDLYYLPKKKLFSKIWLKRQHYDIYLSIELTYDFVLKMEPDKRKKLILWIQDPRPKSAWEKTINTMQAIKDPCFYCQ